MEISVGGKPRKSYSILCKNLLKYESLFYGNWTGWNYNFKNQNQWSIIIKEEWIVSPV